MNQEQVEKRPDRVCEIAVNDGGAYVFVNGTMKSARPGERLFVRIDDRGNAEHAWTEDAGFAAARGDVSAEIEARILPKLREFIADAVRREPMWDNAHSSKIEFELGVQGYDDNDRPDFDVRVEVTHTEEV